MRVNASIAGAYGQLPEDQRAAFDRDYRQRSKSVLTAYLAWLFLGWHYLYLGRVGMQFAFWVTCGFLIVGWFLDFFRVPGMVNRFNEDLQRSLMVQHRAMAVGL